MTMTKLYLLILSILISSTNLNLQSPNNKIVDIHGQLSVKGNRIVDRNNNPVVLRGMSFFWSQWMGKYYNPDCVRWLINDWKCSVVRAAMAVEGGGYLRNPDQEYEKVKTIIETCIDEGIYVVVDWHDHVAHKNEKEAITFFTKIAKQYGKYSNIIYEIYNEPLQISWGEVVKPYSEKVISEIRKIDSNNIVIVGNTTWSQDVDIAANDPLNLNNIVYSLHFYAATHKVELREKAQAALDKGVALFVSEFGTCEANGSGFLDEIEMNLWFNFLEENQISWINWSVADKVETSAALLPGADPIGNWSDTELSPSGKLIKNKIRTLNK